MLRSRAAAVPCRVFGISSACAWHGVAEARAHLAAPALGVRGGHDQQRPTDNSLRQQKRWQVANCKWLGVRGRAAHFRSSSSRGLVFRLHRRPATTLWRPARGVAQPTSARLHRVVLSSAYPDGRPSRHGGQRGASRSFGIDVHIVFGGTIPSRSMFTSFFRGATPSESMFTSFFRGATPSRSMFASFFRGTTPSRSMFTSFFRGTTPSRSMFTSFFRGTRRPPSGSCSCARLGIRALIVDP